MAINWAYIAGFFDGEGNISWPVGKGSFHVAMTQAGDTGIAVLSEIRDFLRLQGISVRIYRAKQVVNRKQVYVLHLAAIRAEGFLKGVLPYLRVKRVAALDSLRFRTLYPGMTVSPLCRAWRSEVSTINNARRSHCKHGHALTSDNLYVYSRRGGTSRGCKTCAKANANARYERLTA